MSVRSAGAGIAIVTGVVVYLLWEHGFGLWLPWRASRPVVALSAGLVALYIYAVEQLDARQHARKGEEPAPSDWLSASIAGVFLMFGVVPLLEPAAQPKDREFGVFWVALWMGLGLWFALRQEEPPSIP